MQQREEKPRNNHLSGYAGIKFDIPEGQIELEFSLIAGGVSRQGSKQRQAWSALQW